MPENINDDCVCDETLETYDYKYIYDRYLQKLWLKIKEFKKEIWIIFLDRLGGVCLGFAEGLASGALTGLSTTGAGGFIFGLVGQAFGAFFGSLLGAFSGIIVGVARGRKATEDTFAHYRECFGNSYEKRIAFRTIVN